MVGAAYGLVAAGVSEELAGEIAFFAVPAEEYVEIDYRLGLVGEGKIAFLGGKPELVELGHFDDVDMAVMIHTKSSAQTEEAVGIAHSSNGFLAKNVRFIGRAAHAGVAPEKGVNALSAATLALSAIDAQRETFRDQDCVRVHPIITKGGRYSQYHPGGGEGWKLMFAPAPPRRCSMRLTRSIGRCVERQLPSAVRLRSKPCLDTCRCAMIPT